ncbi:MAG TPA: Wzz/FepE/Etk N-terminal domain-containing protein, partial [Bacilli bacterium]|nr:Wzz/FepE/Etk N-terminal domain-containing protein [Bacilli bacterium]
MEEKEFDLSQFLDYLKKNILVFILIILIVLTSGIIYSIYIKKPMYKSTTSIILATSTANDTV